MASEHELLNLVGGIYEAVADPEQWEPFFRALAQHLNPTLLSFEVGDMSSQHIFFYGFGVDPRFQLAYQEHFVTRNPFADAVIDIPEGTVGPSQAGCPDSELIKTEYYNDWMRPQNFFHGLYALLQRQQKQLSGLAVYRPKASGPYQEKDVELIRILVPHLQRALQLHSRLAEADHREKASAFVLDRLQFGVLLLNPFGRIVMANQPAEDLLKHKDGLSARNGQLEAQRHAETQALRVLVRQASLRNQGEGFASGGTVSISRPSLKRSYSLLVIPLPPSRFQIGGNAASVAVFVSDPEAEIETIEGILRRLFGLTGAEARLAALLVQGKSLEDISDDLSISVHTTRTQLKAIFSKTGTSRHSELVRLLLTSPVTLRVADNEKL